jgi:phytoene desaturase
MGPSLFTMPTLIDELTSISKQANTFSYKKLETICHYFYEDGTRLKAYSDKKKFANEVATILGEDKQSIIDQLNHSAKLYELTSDIFLNQSLHKLSNFMNLKTLKAVFNLPKLQLNKTMHQANTARFKNEKTIQLFNRFATYNGSNPYQAPALLNIIPHLENNIGAYVPRNGMHDITEHLHKLCLALGVEFKLNTKVENIKLQNNKAVGVITNTETIDADIIVSDADIHQVYNHLLDATHTPKKLLEQEKSSSAVIFYWGIKKEFPELNLHNILFSENYEEEFNSIFKTKQPYKDPTIYINIGSKHNTSEAPEHCENWFILINVPHNASGKPIDYVKEVRTYVVEKINRVLKTDIESYIEVEDYIDPYIIEQRTGSFGGSLYGNSSNNTYAAFLRHANYSSRIKNLYFCGGSVHPGGGIPLCLLSAKIVSDMIGKDS